MLGRVGKLHGVSTIVSPYDPDGARQVSADGDVAFATVTFDEQFQNITDTEAVKLVNTAKSADGADVKVAVSGQLAEQANKPSIGGTGLGVLLAGMVLLLVFGSVFAMALPLLSALASLGTAIGLIGLLSNVMKMPQFSAELVLLIGLGVGIDYALFIVTRHRQGLIAGSETEASVVNAVNTSGRAVLFAGIIVCIALLGMFALGVSFLYGLAVAASIGVAFTMIASLTLLPAMLGFIGPKVLSRRQKRNLATNGPRVVGSGTTGFWPRWADFEARRPTVPALGALAVIVLLALPFFSMRLGSSDQGNDARRHHDTPGLRHAREGFRAGVQRAAAGSSSSTTARPTWPRVDRLVSAVGAQPDVAKVGPDHAAPGQGRHHGGAHQRLPRLRTPGRGHDRPHRPTSAATRSPRRSRVPASPSIVGGTTAIFVDFTHVLGDKLPLFIGLVVLLSFLLLAIVFRSLVIPITAAIMNILSIGAAFGILVAVYQHGTLGSIVRGQPPGPDRGLPARDALLDPLRAVDGLRGLPHQPDPRGVAEVR